MRSRGDRTNKARKGREALRRSKTWRAAGRDRSELREAQQEKVPAAMDRQKSSAGERERRGRAGGCVQAARAGFRKARDGRHRAPAARPRRKGRPRWEGRADGESKGVQLARVPWCCPEGTREQRAPRRSDGAPRAESAPRGGRTGRFMGAKAASEAREVGRVCPRRILRGRKEGDEAWGGETMATEEKRERRKKMGEKGTEVRTMFSASLTARYISLIRARKKKTMGRGSDRRRREAIRKSKPGGWRGRAGEGPGCAGRGDEEETRPCGQKGGRVCRGEGCEDVCVRVRSTATAEGSVREASGPRAARRTRLCNGL